MLKMLSWAGRTVAAGLIVSFLSVWTTGYIVNSYVESLIKQYNIPVEVTPFALTGVWGKLWGADPAEQEAAEEGTGTQGAVSGGTESAEREVAADDAGADTGDARANAAADDEGAAGETAQAGTTDEEGASGETAQVGTTDDPEADPNEALPVFGGEEAVVTEDEILEAKSLLSDKEKDELFSLLVSRLPEDQLQRISTVMENGLTDEELMEIQQLVATYLNREEYDRFMTILKKS